MVEDPRVQEAVDSIRRGPGDRAMNSGTAMTMEEAQRQVQRFFQDPNPKRRARLESAIGAEKFDEAIPIAIELIRELYEKPLDYEVMGKKYTKREITKEGPEVDLETITGAELNNFMHVVNMRMYGLSTRPKVLGVLPPVQLLKKIPGLKLEPGENVRVGYAEVNHLSAIPGTRRFREEAGEFDSFSSSNGNGVLVVKIGGVKRHFHFGSVSLEQDRLDDVDRAALAVNPAIPTGGIDLSRQDAALQVEKDANGGVKVNVDPALIARIEREGMLELVPVIINMKPADLRSLFGPKALI